MDERRRQVVLALAENNMNIQATASRLYMHRNTVEYHLERVKNETGLDPRRFYDLVKLVEMARGGDTDGETV